MRIADLKPGWEVRTNDGHRLGRIKDVGQHFIEVSGGLFSTALYVPSSAIGNVEHETVQSQPGRPGGGRHGLAAAAAVAGRLADRGPA
jgi:hypothetical protein